MQFALVGGVRQAAAPGLSGSCPGCGHVVVAKCGTRRIWHWAHRGVRACDDWWEPESDWHRAWKNHFSADWQEVIQFDPVSGEKHVADVRTEHGLVIEFQHSALHPDERAAREAFHGNMVWVVNGTRPKGALPAFLRWRWSFRPTHLDGILVSDIPDRCFPAAWVRSSVIVAFDFAATENQRPDDELWCLFPGRVRRHAVVAPLPRSELVRMAHEQGFIYETPGIMALVEDHFREQEPQWFGYPPPHLRSNSVS